MLLSKTTQKNALMCMDRALLMAFLLALAVTSLFSNASYAQQEYSAFVSFGDSVSDTGNLASTIVDFPFPFYENRISDGPVVVDYISESIGFNALASEEGGTNYAVSGGNIVGGDREDLTAQIDDYFLRQGNSTNATTLFFILMGGNDLRDLRSETSESQARVKIDLIVNSFIAQLDRLYNAGARQFMIPNQANIGRIPETLNREANEPGISARATNYTKVFNQKLKLRLSVFQQQAGVRLIEYDLFSALETILDSPSSFGFTQSTVGCFIDPPFGFHPDCLFGSRFDRFVFFDNLHPASETNRLIGNLLVEALRNAPATGLPSSPSSASIMGAIFMLLLSENQVSP